MSIKWYNIRSREIRTAETEPMISAMYNSSDLGPNSKEGQDFGWRIAPEVAVQLRRMKNNPQIVQQIAERTHQLFEEIDEKDILKYISDMTDPEDAPVGMQEDYEDEYRSQIRDLEEPKKKTKTTPDTEIEPPAS